MKTISLFLAFLSLSLASLQASPLHDRTGQTLPKEEKEFASLLSLKYRRVFCGRFNAEQRKTALILAEKELDPDSAVLFIMEETGLGLSLKKKTDSE